MAQKTKIQYVGQFYVYGSEAQQLAEAPKKAKYKLPEIKLEKFQNIYIDPLALGGLAVALCMLVLLVMGAYHLRDTRAQYDQMKTILSDVKRENATLYHTYHTSYDLDEIRQQAEKIGMVDAEETERFTIFFSVPQPEEEPTVWDEFVWFVKEMFSNPRRTAAA